MGKQKVVNGQGWLSCDVWASKTTKCQRSPDKDLNVQSSDEQDEWGWSRVKRGRGAGGEGGGCQSPK